MMIRRWWYLLPVFCAGLLRAQSAADSMDADELFLRARDLAFNSQRDSARVLLRVAIRKSPAYMDLRVLYARTLAWDGRRADARKELAYVLTQKPKYLDALNAAIDVELWDDKPEAALVLCNKALRVYPNDEDLLIRRVKIYRDMNKDIEALFTLSILEDINKTNPNITPLRESIKTKSLLNTAGATETHDWFTGDGGRYDPRDELTLYYSRVTPYGTVIGKLNSARRFGNTGHQLEIESYPKIISGLYMYAEYAYSWTKNYPKHRIGLEPFFRLPASFEGSIGTRVLFFGGDPTDIYTASLGYYYGDYWFSLRSYVTPSSASFSRSFTFTVRQYFGGDGTYATLKAGAGSSPDDANHIDPTGTKLNLLKSQSVGTGFYYMMDLHHTADFSLDYKYEEITPGFLVNIYSISVGYRYKF